MATAWLGTSATAAAAATEAIFGVDWAMVPTIAAAAAGFKPTAALTTFTVVSKRFFESACATNSADADGNSAGLTVLNVPKNGLAAGVSLARNPTAANSATAINTLNIFKVFIA